nr:MAG TPA: hypothetical protein [Caudoviricetes sp.]
MWLENKLHIVQPRYILIIPHYGVLSIQFYHFVDKSCQSVSYFDIKRLTAFSIICIIKT